jgi:hypothetical protein
MVANCWWILSNCTGVNLMNDKGTVEGLYASAERRSIPQNASSTFMEVSDAQSNN